MCSAAGAPVGLPKKIVRGATLRLEFVNCGRCPKQHGPYCWYAYWKDYRGVTHKQYIGKHLPENAQANLRNPSNAPTGTTSDRPSDAPVGSSIS
jgi:hypothetical protein